MVFDLQELGWQLLKKHGVVWQFSITVFW